jgi:hypothetical protein
MAWWYRHTIATARGKNSVRADLGSEARLILLLARGFLSEEERGESVRLLSTALDWDYFVEEARSQHVYPLIYRNLKALDFHSVPHRIRADLTSLFKTNNFRNAFLAEELIRLLHIFSNAEIPAIPLKGIALAQLVYGDPALRACADLDILVPRELAPESFRVLQCQGYDSEAKTPFFANLLLRTGKECEFRRHTGGFAFLIDLHWGFLWGGKSESRLIETIWAKAYPSKLFGAPAFEVFPEWQVVLLAAHAARHEWHGLKWLVDIHDLCCSKIINWNQVDEIVTELGCRQPVTLTLSVCHFLFGTEVPATLLTLPLPPYMKLFPASRPDSERSTMFATQMMAQQSEKLRHLARICFLPTEADARVVRLPQFLGVLYYLLRPLRLGLKWSGLLLLSGIKQWPLRGGNIRFRHGP